MKIKYMNGVSLLVFFFFFSIDAQEDPIRPFTPGYTCPSNQTTYPCQTYIFYTAQSPNFLDLANISDLFSMSRLTISKSSNISTPTSPLIPDQSLLIPIQCSCNRINSSVIISYASINYTITPGDTFYLVSSHHFHNLTTYQSVEIVNPNLVPTNLSIGANVVFPLFCKCPTSNQLSNGVSYLISYVFQPLDTLDSISSKFNSTTQSISDVNGDNIQPFDTVFIPVSRPPQLTQPEVSPVIESNSETGDDKKGLVIGLGTGLGVCALLLILVSVLLVYRVRKNRYNDDEEKLKRFNGGRPGLFKNEEISLMADVSDLSDCLDKYKVYEIDELKEATNSFDEERVIEGSVYKARINGDLFAVKKMSWNAYEELKILQKVNHGNLVKLEGFCIEPEEGNCYLVYEYLENGSVHSWLHQHKKEKLNWKARLRIAIDVANGLQYIHEHTTPRVVHKDIKTSNILLDTNMRAKIANFGLARSGCNAITMHIVGTHGYIAPEYLSDGVVSTKIDVFAFGVVLLELVSGREAIDEIGNVLWEDGVKVLNGEEDEKIKRLKEFMDDYLGLGEESLSIDSVMNVVTIAIACLHRDPSRRPSMVDIVYALCKSDDFSFDISEERVSPVRVLGR